MAKRFIDEQEAGTGARFDKLKALDVGSMADMLMRLTAGTEAIPFCQGSPQCDDLLEDGGSEDRMCRNCMIRWLLEEGELP